MTVTINGTSGIAGVDGSAGTPAIQGADTNTGMFFPAADTVAIGTGGTERMRVDSDGDVGIGTSAPSYKLHVVKGASDNAVVIDNGGGAGDGTNPYLAFSGTGGGSNFIRGRIRGAFPDATAGGLIFDTGTSGSMSERMRIDSSGNLLSANGAIYFTSAQYRSNVASSQLQFINNAAGVSLAVNGTSWGSLSDERDKEIIEPITNAVSKVSSLRSVIGRYKVDDVGKRRAFLIAQDVNAVLPEAVTELDDEQKTLILQYTEIIPLLVASIKEQQALITALTARITVLEAK